MRTLRSTGGDLLPLGLGRGGQRCGVGSSPWGRLRSYPPTDPAIPDGWTWRRGRSNLSGMDGEFRSVDGLSRAELVEMVRTMMTGGVGTEADDDALMKRIERNVPDPNVVGLIFYPARPMTPEEIVDAALAYRATPL
jgi:hypothetical protein